MATKTMPFAITFTALATALVVGSYHYFCTVSVLERQINTLEGELTNARAQAVDPASMQEIIGNVKQLPDEDIPAAPDNCIYGSSSGRYTLVEMSDTECPNCRDHFPVLKALIQSSARQINAAILHVPALGEASRRQVLAFECAGEQGGSDAAWKYTQTDFDITGGNGKAVTESLVSLATELGLDGKRLAACTDSKQGIERDTGDLDQAIKLGIQQSPSTLLVDNQTGMSMVLQGAIASHEGILEAIASHSKAGGAK
ncbi:DsbA family protein [Pseudomonas aeruginosa]|uniref:DsbA family protein n=1 Tax=Pseudomonas aeruginosa TaxID=287 RepID=UPI001E58502A|nr:thioredoxin domain-containing protein [Pseudomonas aeruginosa]MCC9289603.1 thioredoxin domain-containing protein [Pseudomonas aeruginosa]UVN18851.1 Protein-disulfide isomerase [Pseudomonas aeruginosa]